MVIFVAQLLSLGIPWIFIIILWSGGWFYKLCCILIYLICPIFILFSILVSFDLIDDKKFKDIIGKHIKTLPKLKSKMTKKNFVPISWRDISGKFNYPQNKKYFKVYIPETFIIIPDEETKNQIELGKFYFEKHYCLNNKSYLIENDEIKTPILKILLIIVLFICNLHFVILYLILKDIDVVPYLIIKVISVNKDFTSNYYNDLLINLNPEIFSKKYSVQEISKLNEKKDVEEVKEQVENYLEKQKKNKEKKEKKRQEILDKLKELNLKEGEFTLITKKLQTATLTIRRINLKVKVEVHFNKSNGKSCDWWVNYDIDSLENNKSNIYCRNIEGGYEIESKYLPGNVKLIANGRSIDIEYPNDYGYPQYEHLDFYEN